MRCSKRRRHVLLGCCLLQKLYKNRAQESALASATATDNDDTATDALQQATATGSARLLLLQKPHHHLFNPPPRCCRVGAVNLKINDVCQFMTQFLNCNKIVMISISFCFLNCWYWVERYRYKILMIFIAKHLATFIEAKNAFVINDIVLQSYQLKPIMAKP